MFRTFVSLFLVHLAISSYSPPLALQMVYMSAIAYESQDAINSWSCPDCNKYKIEHPKALYNSKSNIQAFTGFLPDHSAIIISFRGSTDIKNWITNINTVTTTYPECQGCSVHLGFYQAYQQISPLIQQQVQALVSLYGSAKIFITGHSLGGALAVLCALDIKRIHGNVDKLITMGQPRVGNAKFATYQTASIPSTYRVVNYADTVTHAPPKLFGFRHGGRQIWYNPRGMQSYNECVSEDSNCANSVSTLSFSTDDHSIYNYENMKSSYSWYEGLFERWQMHLRKQSEYTEQELALFQLNNFNRVVAQLETQNK